MCSSDLTLRLCTSKLTACLHELKQLGLYGVEAYHFSHIPTVAAKLHSLAVYAGLAITGGSDFHGESRPDIELGNYPPGWKTGYFPPLKERLGDWVEELT